MGLKQTFLYLISNGKWCHELSREKCGNGSTDQLGKEGVILSLNIAMDGVFICLNS